MVEAGLSGVQASEASASGVQILEAGVVGVQMLGTTLELTGKYRLANMRSGKNRGGNIRPSCRG
jgi:hypothetical protein